VYGSERQWMKTSQQNVEHTYFVALLHSIWMINNYCSVIDELFSHSPLRRQVNLVVFDFRLYVAFHDVLEHVSILFRCCRLYLV